MKFLVVWTSVLASIFFLSFYSGEDVPVEEPLIETVYCPHVEQTVLYNISLSCDLDQDIGHLTPETARKALELMHLAWEQGPYSIRIYETRRGLCRQTQLYKQGTTQKLNSSHVIGEAFDIVFDIEGDPSWDSDHPWEVIGEIGEGLGLVWGGRWKRFPDYGHFELPPSK